MYDAVLSSFMQLQTHQTKQYHQHSKAGGKHTHTHCEVKLENWICCYDPEAHKHSPLSHTTHATLCPALTFHGSWAAPASWCRPWCSCRATCAGRSPRSCRRWSLGACGPASWQRPCCGGPSALPSWWSASPQKGILRITTGSFKSCFETLMGAFQNFCATRWRVTTCCSPRIIWE